MCFRTSHKITVTKEMIKQYANLSNDTNPIHFNYKEAVQQGFQAPIAHGLLTMGLVMNVTNRFTEKGMRIKDYDMQFLKPVYQDETINITAEAEKKRNHIHLKLMGKQVKGSVVLLPQLTDGA
ncbi:hypothetical protein GCM10007216_05730 [Thalassobacillus devorans]|uniref:MaoC-like domain-containing protein n=1 Tax=Thalassobacillus devorans TaxID=279813 RepID=A0ABQ1NIF3_9BACI|nr:MaoC family dehydratase [Thalassobacillus devorans]NIK27481.1 acyl dehydratase [Thalassobacillus devorans]GGC78041.1 hypothetical protein GCM10007216_05730 [Thalassobacillus devorans]